MTAAPPPLRVGVVGLGIGQAHLLAYVLAPERFEVVAICDTDATKRERAATDWGVAAVATTFEELLALDLDVVDVCTPPALHEEQCVAALATGRHVVCEKPLVRDLEALGRLEAAERESAGHLMPIFQYRFAPGIARMKAVVDAGLCGRLFLATSETSWLRGDDYYSAPWRGTIAGEGGGAVFGHGTHAHDLLSFVAGPLVSVQAQVATLVNDIETEDCATAFGATADGGLVSMAVTLGSIREITRLRFCFEHVTAESALDPYEPGNEPWTFDWATPDRAAEAEAVWAAMPAAASGFSGQLAAFHEAVTERTPLPVTLADARRALELVNGWYESARTGRTVNLPPTDPPKTGTRSRFPLASLPMPALLTERDGHSLIVTLNRPERQNAINGEMLVRLYDACVEADTDPEIRTLILTGAGGNFCSGADLKEMAGGHSGDTGGIDVQARLAEDGDLPWKALLRTWRPAVPIILAAEGTAIAGGTELLGATEIRVAGRSAKFGISEVKWSLYPMGGSAVRIPRQIPYARAAELLLCGNHITAQEAHDLGLVNHVVDDGGALDKAKEIASVINANGPLAVKSLLKTLRETNGMEETEALTYEFSYGWDVFGSEDAKEGPRAFKEKRTPNFQGK